MSSTHQSLMAAVSFSGHASRGGFRTLDSSNCESWVPVFTAMVGSQGSILNSICFCGENNKTLTAWFIIERQSNYQQQSLSEQGVWASFGHSKPYNINSRILKYFGYNFLEMPILSKVLIISLPNECYEFSHNMYDCYLNIFLESLCIALLDMHLNNAIIHDYDHNY